MGKCQSALRRDRTGTGTGTGKTGSGDGALAYQPGTGPDGQSPPAVRVDVKPSSWMVPLVIDSAAPIVRLPAGPISSF